MLEETNDTEEIIARVAALDIGKAELVCCIRVPGQGKRGERLQEVKTYTTMTRSLLVLADRLGELGSPGWSWRQPATTGRAPSICWKPTGLRSGWSTRAMSSTCRAGPRPIGWTRCGCASSPSGRCCGPASCRPRRSGGCGT